MSLITNVTLREIVGYARGELVEYKVEITFLVDITNGLSLKRSINLNLEFTGEICKQTDDEFA